MLKKPLTDETKNKPVQVVRSTLDALSAHIAGLDEGGVIIVVNRAWSDFARQNGGAISSLAEGCNYLEVCDNARGEGAEDAAAFASGIRSVLRGEQDLFSLEYACHSLNEQRWFIGRVTRFSEDFPVSIVVAHENITERKHAEMALRQSEERYRLAIEASSDGLWDWDITSGKVTYSPAWGEILGEDTVDPSFNAWGTRLHPADEEHALSLLQETLQGKSPYYRCEQRLRTHDGEWKWVLWRGQVVERSAEGNPLRMSGTMSDIHHRKTTEEELARSQAEFAAMFNSNTDAVVLTDTQHQVMLLNPAFTRLFGYTLEELHGQTTAALYLSVQEFEAQGLQRYNGGAGMDPQPFEIVYRRKDGSTFPAETLGVPVRDVQGRMLGFMGIHRDITERKQAQEALSRSQRLLRATFQSLKSAVFILDGKTAMILDCNLAATEMFGYLREEMIGQTSAILHVEDKFLEEFRNSLYAAVEQEGFLRDFSFSMKRKDGSIFRTEHNVTPLLNEQGERTGWVSVVKDISEKSRAEEALREGEERFRALFNQSLATISDAAGRLIHVSPRYCSMMGYPEDELLEKSFYEITHPDDLEDDLALTRRMHDGEIDAFVLEKRYLRKDGQAVWINMLLSAVRDSSGAILQTIGVFQDISDRKRAEEENALLLSHTRTQAEELGAIVQLSGALRKAQSYSEVLPILVDLSAASLKAGSGILMMVEEEQLNLVYSHGMEMPSLPFDTHTAPHEGALWHVIRGGKARFVPSVGEDDPLSGDAIYDALTSDSGGCVLIPLRVREMPIGLLLLCYKTQQIFNAEQVNLASAIAELAGNTLHRTRLMARMENMVANRTRELGTLYEVILAASSSFDINQALSNALAKIIKVTASDHGAFYLLSADNKALELYVQQNMALERIGEVAHLHLKDSLEGWVVHHNEALMVPDLALDPRVKHAEVYRNQAHAYLGTPMHVQGEVRGVMSVVRELRSFSLDEISLLGSIADHLALIIENARLHQLAEQAAVFEERSRLARDLHDSATQALYSSALFADASLALVEKGDLVQLKTILGRLTEISHQTLKDMRLLVYQLRPAALQQEGLAAALQYRLESVEKRAGMEFEFSSAAEIDFAPLLEESLYWIATEALNNALRHSAATCVKVDIDIQTDCVVLSVYDNGSGFNPVSPPRGGVGLESMRQRAEKIGGALEIISNPGKGATVIARIPLDR